MRVVLRVLMCVTLTAVASPFTLAAQQPATGLTGNAMGATIDRFMYEGSGVVAMSYRFSALRPRQVGAEIGVSLFPQTLPIGVLALAPDLGAS